MEKTIQTTVFGLHLMIDAYHCDKRVLGDANAVYKILDELPGYIGMHKLTLPHVVYASGNESKDPGGWSGFVIIEESHISIHTFTKRGFASIDVYSCKEFDFEAATQYFKKVLNTTDVEVYTQKRGTRYPVENTSDSIQKL